MRFVCRRYGFSIQEFLDLTISQLDGLLTPDDDGEGIEIHSVEELESLLEGID